MKEAIKPDIGSFLLKHPMPEVDSDASIKDESQPDNASESELWAYGTQVEGQIDEGVGYGANVAAGMGGDISGAHTDEEGDVTLQVHDNLQEYNAMGVTPVQGPEERVVGLNTEHIGTHIHLGLCTATKYPLTDIPIDPALYDDTVAGNGCIGASASLSLQRSTGKCNFVIQCKLLSDSFRRCTRLSPSRSRISDAATSTSHLQFEHR